MKSMKHLMAALTLLFLCSWSINTHNAIKITGTVTDAADGSPLPGVSVQVKGSSKGTVTNRDGIYELVVPSEQTVLLFSFVGYKSRELKVGSKRTLDVKLSEDVEALEEVVVTGRGKARKQKAMDVVMMAPHEHADF